jgi:predicted nucleic acid-binding protein
MVDNIIVQLYNNKDAMKLIIDTSSIIAVIANEAQKSSLVSLASGADLIAPSSIHWEVGNAFSAMLRRGRITLEQAQAALRAYENIPIQFYEVDLKSAIILCHAYNLYAYDAYVLECAKKLRAPLLTLDTSLAAIARKAGVTVLETPL